MNNAHTVQIAREYVAVVDAMRSGQYTTDELRQLDSERQGLHNDLIRLTGYARSTDMYRAACLIVRDSEY